MSICSSTCHNYYCYHTRLLPEIYQLSLSFQLLMFDYGSNNFCWPHSCRTILYLGTTSGNRYTVTVEPSFKCPAACYDLQVGMSHNSYIIFGNLHRMGCQQKHSTGYNSSETNFTPSTAHAANSSFSLTLPRPSKLPVRTYEIQHRFVDKSADSGYWSSNSCTQT